MISNVSISIAIFISVVSLLPAEQSKSVQMYCLLKYQESAFLKGHESSFLTNATKAQQDLLRFGVKMNSS